MIKYVFLTVLVLEIMPSFLRGQNHVSGRIIDEEYKPVSDVAVVLDGPATKIFYSDSSGYFSIPDVQPGIHRIGAYKFGWLGVEKKITVDREFYDAGTFKFRFGEYDNNGTIDLRDLSLIGDRLNDTITNLNQFLDINENRILDTAEFFKAASSVETKGNKCPEWLISKPDFVTFIPSNSDPDYATNQHYLITRLKNGRLLGIWTAAYMEGSTNQSMLCHWSDDNGKTWSKYKIIDGPLHDGKIASWGFSIYVPEVDRFYVFYNKDIGTRIFHQGDMMMRYTSDGGQTWSNAYKYRFEPGEYTPKDSLLAPQWWAYQKPLRVGNKYVLGFTEVLPHDSVIFFSCEIRFLSFENITTEMNPNKLIIKTYPRNGKPGLRGSYLNNSNRSTLQEPSIVQLSDGRLYCVMRSGGGSPFFSVSRDTGQTWTVPEKMRYGDGLEFFKQPLASCPIYSIMNGKFVYIFHNNSGDANGGSGPSDLLKVRTPAYIVVGTEDLTSHQPIKFGKPILFFQNHVRPYGPSNRTEIATYPSLTDFNNSYILWYADRKHFLLGKRLPNLNQ
jgi:hypothetical protein